MSEFIKLMEGMKKNNLSRINSCKICDVDKFNGSTADLIAPNGNKLIDVPIMKKKYKSNDIVTIKELYLEKGDKVVVIFSDEPLDGVGKRQHDLIDGIVIGVI